MSTRTRGKLVVISGPSGTGKTSICKGLLEALPNADWSVSVTTRPKRANEIDGESYKFIDRDEFEKLRAAGKLLECAEYVGNWYGTPLAPIQDAIAAGRYIVLEIDVQGGAQVAQKLPDDSIRVFVLPPTMETLRARLEGRKTESEALLKKRLAEADGEIAQARQGGCYQHFITNDILEDSIRQVVELVLQETQPA